MQEPPKLAIKFANTVLVLGILFSSLLIVYAVYKLYNPPEPVSPVFYIINIVCGGIFAILFGLGLKASNNLKINLSLLSFVIGITVYGFEFYLTYLNYTSNINSEVMSKMFF